MDDPPWNTKSMNDVVFNEVNRVNGFIVPKKLNIFKTYRVIPVSLYHWFQQIMCTEMTSFKISFVLSVLFMGNF